MTFYFLGKLSIALGNKHPSDPCKNQGTRSAYGNYFPLDRDLQKRHLEILCCLLVAALLNYSPSKYSEMVALNSHDTAIVNIHLCVCMPLQKLKFISAIRICTEWALLMTRSGFGSCWICICYLAPFATRSCPKNRSLLLPTYGWVWLRALNMCLGMYLNIFERISGVQNEVVIQAF